MILRNDDATATSSLKTNSSIAFISRNIISSRQSAQRNGGMDGNMIIEEEQVDFTRDHLLDKSGVDQPAFLSSATNDETKIISSSIAFNLLPKQSNTSFLTTPKQQKRQLAS